MRRFEHRHRARLLNMLLVLGPADQGAAGEDAGGWQRVHLRVAAEVSGARERTVMVKLLIAILLSHGAPARNHAHARELAEAIAAEAPDAEWAIRTAVWATNEDMPMDACPAGDGGKSLGPLQLQRVSVRVACTPRLAVYEWLARARASLHQCGTLAIVASGRCDRGRDLVAQRLREAQRWALVANSGDW
jgi:hypothetical protein